MLCNNCVLFYPFVLFGGEKLTENIIELYISLFLYSCKFEASSILVLNYWL